MFDCWLRTWPEIVGCAFVALKHKSKGCVGFGGYGLMFFHYKVSSLVFPFLSIPLFSHAT